ncbi:MAG: 4Fe-4S binding protein [Syntrophotaleaceae bacterium]
MIEIDKDLCKGCGLCTVACPRNLIELRQREGFAEQPLATIREEDKCPGCAMCAAMCPDIAICVYSATKNSCTLELTRAFWVVKDRVDN